MTDRSVQLGSAVVLSAVVGGLVAMSQLSGPDPTFPDQSPPRDGLIDQGGARDGAIPRAVPTLPPPTVDELLSALLSGIELQPAGLLLVGELCNGMQIWADPDHANQVHILNERVYATPGTTLGMVPAHVRACDRNGDGLINGLDLQPFVTESLTP